MNHSTNHDEAHVEIAKTTNEHHTSVKHDKKPMPDICHKDGDCAPTKTSNIYHLVIIGLVAVSLILNILTLSSLSQFRHIFFEMNIGSENMDNFKKITENKIFKERQKEQFETMLKQLETQASSPKGGVTENQPKMQIQGGTGQ